MAQSKIEFGLTAEGSWFMPKVYSKNVSSKDGYGAGIGVYASKSIFSRLSVDLGFTYQYKEMQEYRAKNYLFQYYYTNYGGYGGYGSYGYGNNYGNVNDLGSNYSYEYPPEPWRKYQLHYIVVPIHFQLLVYKDFFVLEGVESSWLMNYSYFDKKPEFNWVTGLGNQRYKLKWSVKYIYGLKVQTFNNEPLSLYGFYTYTSFRNNMLQVSLSYPLWQKN